jgi:hypothetical protein
MPGPLGRPLETVSPEVSECSRMPWSRRPVTNAATPWAPSWVIVTSMRVYGQTARGRTSAAARVAASATTTGAGGGCTVVARRQTSAISSTTQASRILAWNPGISPRNGPQCARRSRPIGCPGDRRALGCSSPAEHCRVGITAHRGQRQIRDGGWQVSRDTRDVPILRCCCSTAAQSLR